MSSMARLPWDAADGQDKFHPLMVSLSNHQPPDRASNNSPPPNILSILFIDVKKHPRHSRESPSPRRKPVTPYLIRGRLFFRRSDGCVVYGAIALGCGGWSGQVSSAHGEPVEPSTAGPSIQQLPTSKYPVHPVHRCKKTPPSFPTPSVIPDPNRHSRESGNPGGPTKAIRV